MWRKGCDLAQVKDFVFHDLRHCYITRKRLEGMPDFLIQKQVGHSGAEMTARYTTVEESELRRLEKVG